MRDCVNATMREQLPELLHGQLSPEARAAVEQHVAGCADCAVELALLRQVRAVAHTPRVDIDRIVAAIPPYAPTQGRSPRRVPPMVMAIAAALVIAAGAVTLWWTSRQHEIGLPTPQATIRIADPSIQAPLPTPARSVAKAVPQLSLGEPLSDLSDHDLRALAETVDQLEAVPSADVDAAEPSLIDLDREGDS